MMPPTPESTQSTASFAAPAPGPALPPQDHHHHHHMTSGPRLPPMPPSQQQAAPAHNIMMAGLWGLPHPPPLQNPDSPGNSSSDSGSMAGAAQTHGGATSMAGTLPPLAAGGRGGGGSAAMAGGMDGEWVSRSPPHIYILVCLACLTAGYTGDQSHYQEDAINALFPYDPQTGDFAGFADPVAIGMVNNYNWVQSA